MILLSLIFGLVVTPLMVVVIIANPSRKQLRRFSARDLKNILKS